MPQVGELDRTTYTVSIEASFAVVLFSGVSTEWRRDHSILAGRTIGFFVVPQCPFSEDEGTDAK